MRQMRRQHNRGIPLIRAARCKLPGRHGLQNWRRRRSAATGLTVPLALKDIGMKELDLDKACDIALQNQYPNPNPRPLERWSAW